MKPLIIHESPRKEVRGIMTMRCKWCLTVKTQGDPSLPESDGICEPCLRVYFPDFSDQVMNEIKKEER